jgi:MFS family permease
LSRCAPTVGPVVGGWITQTYSWHWLFLINVVPGLIASAATPFLLPRHRASFDDRRTFDGWSLMLMALALASLMIGLKQSPHEGWLSSLCIGLCSLCVLSGGFCRRVWRWKRCPRQTCRMPAASSSDAKPWPRNWHRAHRHGSLRRTGVHADALRSRLLAGDTAAAEAIGLDPDLLASGLSGPITPSAEDYVRPMIEKAAFVWSVNDAWTMLAAFALLAVLLVPFAWSWHQQRR